LPGVTLEHAGDVLRGGGGRQRQWKRRGGGYGAGRRIHRSGRDGKRRQRYGWSASGRVSGGRHSI